LIDVPADDPVFLADLDRALGTTGYSLSDIKVIIVTHPHLDHCGSAGTISEMSGAEIWATRETGTQIANFQEESREEEEFSGSLLKKGGVPAGYADRALRFFRHMIRFGRPARVSRYLEEGDLISFGKFQLTVHHVPGHTPWCIMLADARAGVAFTGDFILKDISSNPLIQRPGKTASGYRSLNAFKTSFERARKMNFRLALPGHGDLIERPSERISELLRFMERRRDLIMGTLMRDHYQTAFDIMRSIFPDLARDQSFLALSEVLAYLQVLEDQGLVGRTGGLPERYALIGGALPSDKS